MTIHTSEFANWRKSTFSNPNGNECVEVGSGQGVVGVRDTKHRDGGTLAFKAIDWKQFVDHLA